MVLAEDLRKAVLQSALQGKLTKQLSSDSDVDILIVKIKKEKELLVVKKKARKDPAFEKIEENEKEFDIPDNWRWVRLGEIGIYKKGPFGSALTKSIFVPKSETVVKVYEQKNAIQKDATLGEYYISKKYYDEKMQGFTVESGDIIVSCAGTIGETYVMPENIEVGIINQALMRMNIAESINLRYFLIYFDHVLKKNAKKSSNGSAIKNIPPFEIFKNMLIPLPPIEEQQRIVEKVHVLMKEIDEYEVMEKQLEEIKKKFPDDMKKAVLQYAMQGRLTKQLSTDSDVNKLLVDIEEEKKERIKLKEFKVEKKVPALTEIEKPFDIPDTWKWSRLYDIGSWGAGATPKRSESKYYEKGTIPWLKTGELNDGYVTKSEEKITDLALKECSLQLNKIGDVMIAMYGATIGKLGIAQIEATTNQACCTCTPFKGILNKYLFYFLMANRTTFIKQGAGSGQPNISKEKIIKTVIPIPPIEEQQRIVDKLDQILPLIEELKE